MHNNNIQETFFPIRTRMKPPYFHLLNIQVTSPRYWMDIQQRQCVVIQKPRLRQKNPSQQRKHLINFHEVDPKSVCEQVNAGFSPPSNKNASTRHQIREKVSVKTGRKASRSKHGPVNKHSLEMEESQLHHRNASVPK